MDLEYQNISYTEPTFDEPFTDSKYTRVIWSIFSIVGICGNLFTISALIQSQTLKVQAATKFIISLATADLLFCSIILPINVIAQDLNETLCTVYIFFYAGTCTVSMSSLLAITINRYIIICRNSIYNKVYSNLNVAIMIFIIWLVCFGVNILPVFGIYGQYGIDAEKNACKFQPDKNSNEIYLIADIILFIYYILPCLAIIACYAAIFFKVRKTRKDFQLSLGDEASNNRETDLQLLKMIVIIFAAFLICVIPKFCTQFIEKPDNSAIVDIILSLFRVNFIINPFIYGFK